MIVILKDIYHGREWSEMPRDDMIFMKKVAFIESISESTLQLILSCLILRSYGTSSDPFSLAVQIFSFVTSLLSIVTSFGSVSTYQEHLILFDSSLIFIHYQIPETTVHGAIV